MLFGVTLNCFGWGRFLNLKLMCHDVLTDAQIAELVGDINQQVSQ